MGIPLQALAAPLSDRFRNIETVTGRIIDSVEALWPDDPLVPGLKVNLGVGFAVTPEYTGSDEYDTTFIPIIRLQYKNMLSLTGNTVRYYAQDVNGFRWGALASYSSGRKAKDHTDLIGLDNISATIVFGPFVEYRLKHYRINAELRQALGSGQGLEGRVGASMGLLKTEKWAAQAGINVKWNSAKRMRTQFGITPEESAASAIGLDAYRPGSGFQEAAISVGGQYKFNDRWSWVQFIEYTRLLGDAKNSPLVKAGSANQVVGGTGVIYSF